ncbi:hypothetical protein EVAR_78592_1 [Eumeta japonica]|uniref:Uncharacterized protein n=1 Tax=Eumeta variegata TaxID=151549 RepID=A0A4C1U950_EUMVA|nr:hypothetical protein EVAR_78592_1 [Eumeta japonica]
MKGGEESRLPGFSLTGRNTTAEATTSRQYSTRVWYRISPVELAHFCRVFEKSVKKFFDVLSDESGARKKNPQNTLISAVSRPRAFDRLANKDAGIQQL